MLKNLFKASLECAPSGTCYILPARACSALMSALFIPGNKALETFSLISPHIDFPERAKDLPKLQRNLALRNLNIDVTKLVSEWQQYSSLVAVRNEKREKVRLLREKLVDARNGGNINEDVEDEFQKLMQELQAISPDVWKYEETTIVSLLALPNELNPKVDTMDRDVSSLFVKPSLPYNLSHTEVGNITGTLEFTDTSPNAYFFKGTLAILELAISDFVSSFFKSRSFKLFSTFDFVKSVIFEGCGFDFSDKSASYVIESTDDTVNKSLIHLVGGASLPSLIAVFAKRMLKLPPNDLTKVITIGRCYTPQSERLSLFSCHQSTAADGLLLFPNSAEREEAVCKEIVSALTELYSNFELHFKVVTYSAQNLQRYESSAYGMFMYSNNLKKYIEVGRISVCGTYISKRLWLMQKITGKSASFLSVIHFRAINITRWIGILLENTQNENGEFCIPGCLKNYVGL